MKDKLKKILPKSEFAKNVLTLMTGTTIAQAIPVLLSPVLTRIYSDNDFGLFAPFNSLVMGLATIAALRYDLTIVLPKTDEESKSLVSLSRKISIVMMIVISVAIAFFITPLVNALKSVEIKYWFYLIGFVVFVRVNIVIIQMFLNRKKEYKTISSSRMIQGGGVAVFQILFGEIFSFGGVTGLVLGFVLGQLSSLAYLFTKTKDRFENVKNQDKQLLNKYKKMPLLNGPNALVDAIRTNGINIIIVNLFTTALLGQFSLAWRILQAPLGLINGAFSQVCFQQLSVLDKTKHHQFLKKSIKRSFFIGILPFSILYFLAPYLFSFVYGESWVKAGEIGSTLVPWLFLNLITSPISTYFIVVQRQGALLIFAIFYMLIPFVTIWFLKYDFMLAMKGLSYSMSLMLIIFLIMVLYYSKKDEKVINIY